MKESVEALRQDISALRADMAKRDDVRKQGVLTRIEQTYRRRTAAFVLLFVMIVGLWAQDIHVEQCVPTALDRQIEYEFLCDATSPTHGHTDAPEDASWPTAGSLTGIVIYATLAGGFFWWTRLPQHQKHVIEEDPTKESH